MRLGSLVAAADHVVGVDGGIEVMHGGVKPLLIAAREVNLTSAHAYFAPGVSILNATPLSTL